MTIKQFFKSKCPVCNSDKLYFHPDGDAVSLLDETFIKSATCQNCRDKFSISGMIKGPITILQE